MARRRTKTRVVSQSGRWRARVVAAEECPVCGEQVGVACVGGAAGRERKPHMIRLTAKDVERPLTQRYISDYLP